MDFRLVYAGDLLKSSKPGRGRLWEKHQIRLYLHQQLKTLWETHPLLTFYSEKGHIAQGGFANRLVGHQGTKIEDIAKRYEGFVPVVNEDFGMFCDLDILFLRAENTGGLVNRDSGGGDIDNRINPDYSRS